MKRQEVFDWQVFEVAGMREETLVMHHDHTEAMLMNILIEMEMRLRKLESEYYSDKPLNMDIRIGCNKFKLGMYLIISSSAIRKYLCSSNAFVQECWARSLARSELL